jgi:hypothetical protein
MTHRIGLVALAAALSVATTMAAANDFISTWKSPEAGPLNFVGRKVAAVVIVDSLNLQMSAEEALAREITARGAVGVPSYRIIPREEHSSGERARGWFERANVEGLVILRLVETEKDKVYSSVVWASGYYANAWDYYGYGWGAAYPIGKPRTETTITVETLLYDLSKTGAVWAGVSRTTDPKDPASFMEQLAKDVAEELRDAKLTR